MLTGRESLTRLVGKRRRFLPNRYSILAIPHDQGKSNINEHQCDNSREEVENGDGRKKRKVVDDVSSSDWVECLDCCNKVHGDDCAVNMHLDKCLARGSKRKLTQRTLFQLNFSSKPNAEIKTGSSNSSVSGVIQSGTYDKSPSGGAIVENGRSQSDSPNDDPVPSDGLVQSLFDKSPSVGASEEHGRSKCNSLVKLDITQSHVSDPTVKLTADNGINMVETCSTSLQDELSKSGTVSAHDTSLEVLETYIVGRRFSDEKEIYQGTNISLLRDPNNIKDHNAIKVISADTCKVLGFLPRELSHHLSPLINQYCLSSKGHVINVPKHSLDTVWVQILFQNLTSFDNRQIFESLWQSVLHAVESLKAFPPNREKYQHNFCLLIQEVLQNNFHLFTEDEKNLLESFTSLSNDSQRLFIRLYMRKGPWFRMSNISYAEISNTREAAKELCEMGYLCSLSSINELHDDDLEEILNMLTVPELREILFMLVKKGHRGCLKQDMIASLISSYKDGLCTSFPNVILEKAGKLIQLSVIAESLIWRCERLFFLNGEQDLTAFLLVDLGIVKYPTYRCLISDQIFASRNDLLAYEEAIEVAQILDQSLDANNVESVLKCIRISEPRISSSFEQAAQSSTSESLASFLSCFSASWIYSKVVLLGVSFLEKEHRLDDLVPWGCF